MNAYRHPATVPAEPRELAFALATPSYITHWQIDRLARYFSCRFDTGIHINRVVMTGPRVTWRQAVAAQELLERWMPGVVVTVRRVL